MGICIMSFKSGVTIFDILGSNLSTSHPQSQNQNNCGFVGCSVNNILAYCMECCR